MARPRTDLSTPATPDRLLAAAEVHFALRGFEGARLADIAQEAGIRRPSLLYHFSSKRALYDAVVKRAFEVLGQVLGQAILFGGPFAQQVERLIDTYENFLAERPALSPVFIREIMDENGPGAALMLERVVPLLAPLENFVRREGPPKTRNLPVRAAIMQIASTIMLRAAAGAALKQPLWGDVSDTKLLARLLFVQESTT